MLLSFSVENWLSFRDKAEFSMLASREKQYGDRLPTFDAYKIKLLPVASIYGGNGTGKSNLIKALDFAKKLIVRGVPIHGSIPREPYKLNQDSVVSPSHFKFCILTENKIFDYSFSCDSEKIISEKLVQVNAKSEIVWYDRGEKFSFHKSIKDDAEMKILSKGTRPNQLFLNVTVSQQVQRFLPVFNWFAENLIIIFPNSRFQPVESLLDNSHTISEAINKMLSKFDTGIASLVGEEIPAENIPFFSENESRLKEELPEGGTVRIPQNERYVITKINGEIKAKKLATLHTDDRGNDVKFNFTEESDGTQRLIDLLPAFIDLSQAKSEKVYFIDELDRNLHSLLTRHLVEMYLKGCNSESRTQLVFTTHDLFLMSQDTLRRDEMWIVDKIPHKGASLISFSDFKEIRNDKDIRKSYLSGRMGGIPNLLVDALCLKTP